MSGGQIAIVPPDNRDTGRSLCGNAAAYGATGGALFIAGRAGQRFGVRNSGATLVCEGAGKYAFEYMTGGVGAVLGPCSAALASGMTGGELFVLDDGQLARKLHADARQELMDADAQARLRELLRRHREATGSPVAGQLLEDAALFAAMKRVVAK